MLAERRTRVKWCLNPNGKSWSSDNNKFGQRMLEKMGWTEGQGLGKEMQGPKEHLKVSYKCDKKGLGSKNYGTDLVDHQNGYDNLLLSLGASYNTSSICDEPSNIISLEQRSKQSKSRLHYQKFTRGKDLSKYSSKDLANIFGKDVLPTIKVIECKKFVTNQTGTQIAHCGDVEPESVEMKKKKRKRPTDKDSVNNLDCNESEHRSEVKIYKKRHRKHEKNPVYDTQKYQNVSVADKNVFSSEGNGNDTIVGDKHETLESDQTIDVTAFKKKKKKKKKEKKHKNEKKQHQDTEDVSFTVRKECKYVSRVGISNANGKSGQLKCFRTDKYEKRRKRKYSENEQGNEIEIIQWSETIDINSVTNPSTRGFKSSALSGSIEKLQSRENELKSTLDSTLNSIENTKEPVFGDTIDNMNCIQNKQDNEGLPNKKKKKKHTHKEKKDTEQEINSVASTDEDHHILHSCEKSKYETVEVDNFGKSNKTKKKHCHSLSAAGEEFNLGHAISDSYSLGVKSNDLDGTEDVVIRNNADQDDNTKHTKEIKSVQNKDACSVKSKCKVVIQNVDLNSFKGANLNDIIGYGLMQDH